MLSVTLKKKTGGIVALVVLMALLLGSSGMATASTPKSPAVSPAQAATVHPDGQVTFTLNAPQANEVILNWQNMVGPSPRADPIPMTRDEKGVWSVTIGPLAPNWYGYGFILDGVGIADPANRNIWSGDPTSWSPIGGWSYVFVPGPESDYIAQKPVPHGAVATVRYYSHVAQKERQMQVYTPPGYNKDNRRYPVLYIMHGAGGNDTDWIVNMRANFILDNLLAEGQIVPMILVSADGYVTTNYLRDFPQELLGSIVPYIEENYRAAPGAKNRALAGLSLGGMWTTATHFTNPGNFAYIGVFSSGFRVTADYPETLLANPEINRTTELLWITSGDESDITYNLTMATLDLFDKYNINHTYVQDVGGHVWDTWRKDLRDFAPLIFK